LGGRTTEFLASVTLLNVTLNVDGPLQLYTRPDTEQDQVPRLSTIVVGKLAQFELAVEAPTKPRSSRDVLSSSSFLFRPQLIIPINRTANSDFFIGYLLYD
jgi:hypothetical protein